MFSYFEDLTKEEQEREMRNILLPIQIKNPARKKVHRVISPFPYPIYTFPFNIIALREEKKKRDKLVAERAAAAEKAAAELAETAPTEIDQTKIDETK